MNGLIDETGNRYGRLLVVRRAENKGKVVMWECKCDCGKTIITRGTGLRYGSSKSCGCVSTESLVNFKKTHGATGTNLYRTYTAIKQRCYNPNTNNYANYGGRGIYMCDEWKNDAASFVKWAKNNGYKKGMEIDRIDNDGPYAPWNCRYVTHSENNRNKRDNHLITFRGETKCLTEWAEGLDITPKGLEKRLRLGWSVEKALTTPSMSPHKNNVKKEQLWNYQGQK